MNRLVFAVGAACAACLSPVFAQSTPTVTSDVIQHPSTDFASAAISQNFQYMNHPPPLPAPASSAAPTGGGRGHRHRQMSSSSDSGGASAQP
jgi:hypothetical protein